MLKILLSPQDVQTVLKALGNMPLEQSLQAFMRIQQQMAEQAQQQQGVQTVAPPAVPPGPPPQPNGVDG